MLHKIPLASLSSNKGYRGRRFITPELKRFKENMCMLLPRIKIPEGKLSVDYVFGVSSKMNDIDNQIKFVQDALSEKYLFNDRVIYRISAEKVDVKKGAEFISFDIIPYSPDPDVSKKPL